MKKRQRCSCAYWVLPISKKGEVSFHFKDYACERGEWITSYSELARRTGLIRRAAVTAVGHLVEAGWLTVTAVGRMTKFTLTFYDAPPQPDGHGSPQGAAATVCRLRQPLYMYQNRTVYNTGETV